MKGDPEDPDGQAPAEDEDTPAIYSVDRTDGVSTLNRRTFLDIAAMAAGTAAVASGCVTRVVPPPPRPSPQPVPSPTPEPVRKVGNAHKSAVTALAINAAGTVLASGDKDGTIKLWQLPEGVLLQAWSAPASAIRDLAFPHADDALWSLDSEGTLKRWHLPDGKEVPDTRPVPGLRALAVPEAADWYGVRAGSVLEIRSQLTGEKLRTLAGLNEEVTDLATTSNGRLLVAGGTSGKLGVWTEPAVVPPPVEPRPARTKSGKRGTPGKPVPATEPPVAATKVSVAAAGSVNAITVTPDGTLALSAHAGRYLQVWPLPGLDPVRQYESGFGEPYCVAVRPQQDLFVVGSEKPDIGVWPLRVENGTPLSLTGHMAPVRALVITPDGSLLISAGDDKTIRLWSLPEGKYLRVLVDLESNTSKVEGITYQGTDIYGRTIIFTLPCGSPIPPGAVCVCNCVPGSLAVPTNFSQNYNAGGYCTCDTVCTCNTICTCQSVGGRYVTYWYPN
jgi:WD40 repeat protein